MALSRRVRLVATTSLSLSRTGALGRPAPPVAENSITITLKMPESLAGDVRAHASKHDLTTSEVIRRAVAAFLAAKRRAWLSGNKYDVASNSSSHSIGCALPSLNRLTTFWFRIGSELSAA